MNTVVGFFVTWGWLFGIFVGVILLVALLNWLDCAQARNRKVRQVIAWLPLHFSKWRKNIAYYRYDFTSETRWKDKENKIDKYIRLGLQ